jgi:hypothetical protein
MDKHGQLCLCIVPLTWYDETAKGLVKLEWFNTDIHEEIFLDWDHDAMHEMLEESIIVKGIVVKARLIMRRSILLSFAQKSYSSMKELRNAELVILGYDTILFRKSIGWHHDEKVKGRGNDAHFQFI